LYKTYNVGWSRLSGAVRGKTIVTSLTTKQREIAKLAAFGMSNKEIADKLDMSLAGVKQALVAITDKTGVGRSQFAAFL
jgi:DNA-binding CsgD family transcriptional regulator